MARMLLESLFYVATFPRAALYRYLPDQYLAPRPEDASGFLEEARLDERSFTQAQCDAFFAAVLVNDDPHAPIKLPGRVRLDYSQEQLVDCFRLCRQVWKQGVQKSALLALTRKLIWAHDLSPEERTQFKNIRAKFKQMRYAHVLYSTSHEQPPFLQRLTVALGKLQDAYKGEGRIEVLFRALIVRFLLCSPIQHLMSQEINRIQIVNSDEFRLYMEHEIDRLRIVLQQEGVTGEEFHASRKIIGRQISFFDTLRTIAPSPDAYLMSRSLAAINGLMGAMHDELIERRMKGIQDYHQERFALPDEISRPLKELVARYPQ